MTAGCVSMYVILFLKAETCLSMKSNTVDLVNVLMSASLFFSSVSEKRPRPCPGRSL